MRRGEGRGQGISPWDSDFRLWWERRDPALRLIEILSRTVPHMRLFTASGAEKTSITRFGQPSGGSVAIDLQSGYSQTGDPVGINSALPSEEFFYGKLIAAANFLQTDGAASHRIDYHRLASGDPALRVRRRQIHRGGGGARYNFAVKQVVQPNVVVHGCIVEQESLKKP